jgi:hypothetical protein
MLSGKEESIFRERKTQFCTSIPYHLFKPEIEGVHELVVINIRE